jgi:hypothetical protein
MMSIRLKVALAIAVVLLVAGAAVLYTMQALYTDAIQAANETSVKVAAETFASLEQQDIEKLEAVNDVLRTRDDLQELYLAGDREGLYEASAPLFEQLKENYAITHLYFETAEPSSTVFLRVHNKDKFDDELARDTYLASVESKSYGAGKDLGKTAFALRVVHPWYDTEDNLVGYVETGQEIEEFLDIMSEQTGDDLALILSKDALNAEDWAEMRANRDMDDNWDANETFVVAHATSEDMDTGTYDFVEIAELEADGEAYATDVAGSTDVAVGAFPVQSTTGEQVGAVIVQHDISTLVAQLASTRTQMVFILIGVGIVLVAIVVIMLNSLVFARLDATISGIETVMVKVAGGDFDVSMPDAKSSDEIGRFEGFIKDFVAAVSTTLKQMSGK